MVSSSCNPGAGEGQQEDPRALLARQSSQNIKLQIQLGSTREGYLRLTTGLHTMCTWVHTSARILTHTQMKDEDVGCEAHMGCRRGPHIQQAFDRCQLS